MECYESQPSVHVELRYTQPTGNPKIITWPSELNLAAFVLKSLLYFRDKHVLRCRPKLISLIFPLHPSSDDEKLKEILRTAQGSNFYPDCNRIDPVHAISHQSGRTPKKE